MTALVTHVSTGVHAWIKSMVLLASVPKAGKEFDANEVSLLFEFLMDLVSGNFLI